jgi:hypothetical protein
MMEFPRPDHRQSDLRNPEGAAYGKLSADEHIRERKSQIESMVRSSVAATRTPLEQELNKAYEYSENNDRAAKCLDTFSSMLSSLSLVVNSPDKLSDLNAKIRKVAEEDSDGTLTDSNFASSEFDRINAHISERRAVARFGGLLADYLERIIGDFDRRHSSLASDVRRQISDNAKICGDILVMPENLRDPC